MSENEKIQELRLESKEPSDTTSTVIIEGVPGNVHNDPDTIRKILDLLKMPEGTTVKVNLKASSSVVR